MPIDERDMKKDVNCNTKNSDYKLNHVNRSTNDTISNLTHDQLLKSDLFVQASKIQCNNIRISTGADSLDKMIGGGLETKTITQFYGQPGSCKTQLCFTLCALLPSNFKCIFIDTEGTFRLERIQEISRARKVNALLENIFVSRAYTTTELENCMDNTEKKIDSDPVIKLLIIDSMTNLYRIEYSGAARLSQRQHQFTKYMYKIKNLAESRDIVVVITNQVYLDYSSSHDKDKAVGGYSLNYPCTNIIKLIKNRDIEITAKLLKSPFYKNNMTYLLISEGGIIDDEIDNKRIEEIEKRKI
ncbi:MAG: hypothetical protein WCB31_11125 [Nitrososphaeraceae archaeon]